MTVPETLQRSELFRGFSSEILQREIFPCGQMQEFSEGQYVFSYQQKVERLGVLLSGKIHILHIYPDGNYGLMNALTPPDVLAADLACTPSCIAPYYALAAADCRIFSFPADVFLRPGALSEAVRVQLLWQLLTLISNDSMRKEYRLALLSQKGLRERVLTYLSMQAKKRRTNTFAIPFSRDELASFLCVNRSALSHELSLMQREGLIRFRKNVFTLCDLTPPQP